MAQEQPAGENMSIRNQKTSGRSFARPRSTPVRLITDLDQVPEAPSVQAPAPTLEQLVRVGYSEEEIHTLVAPKRTLARRRAAKEPLTVDETDKALRLQRIASQAERVFGDADKAHRWLRRPQHALGNDAPIAFLASETGARLIEDILVRIDHGIFA
jgi:putative toxin-antitoxin system antitoxin component (TIGR02293 family)